MSKAGPSSLFVGQLAALAATPVALWSGACAPEACVAVGTRVATPFGWVSVEVLRPGDLIFAVCVATGTLVAAPLRAVRRGRRECVALVSATGERLVATPDHPIFAPTLGGFVDAGRMALGQVTRALIVEEGEAEARVREADLAPCETYAGVHEVFDLTVEGAFPTFVAEGFVVHNKSTLTDPSSTSTEGSGGPTGSETGIPTGSGTGGSGSGTGGSGTGEPTGTSGTSGTSGSGTSGSTGGGSGVCEAALGDYGDCDAVLGVAFDGTECATVSGCDCAPDCDKFFPDVASCALTCAEAGHCNPDRLEPAGILEDPVVMGSYCDELDACVSDPSLEGIFEQIFGMLACEGMGFPCPEGTLCHGLFAGPLAEEAWTQTCAATLVSGGGTLYCVLFGP